MNEFNEFGQKPNKIDLIIDEGEGFWGESRRQTFSRGRMVNNRILDKAFQSPRARVGGLSAEFSSAGSGLVGTSPPPTFPGRGD